MSSVPRSPSSAARSKLLRTSTSTLEDDYAGVRLSTYEDEGGDDRRVPFEPEDEPEDEYEHVALPPRRESVAPGRRAGRVPVGDGSVGGGVRMQGKMSVSELMG